MSNYICSHGHKWSRPIDKLVKYNFTCDYCESRKLLPEFNSFGAKYQGIASEWDYERNDYSPFDVLPTSNNYAFWICKDCNGSYLAMIKERVTGDADCPFCNGRRPNPGVNTLKAIYQELAIEYSYRNNNDPDNIFSTNKTQHIWECKICNTEWYATIEQRLNGEKPCSGCSGERAIPGKTSFKALYPELVKEYSEENINDPDVILPNYSITVTWNCDKCKMDWFSSVRDRVNGEKECPFCSGKKAIPGKTSYKALYPELMNEWKYISNLLLVNPDNVLPTATKEVWWECPRCNKSYSITIKDKVNIYKRNIESCLFCKGYRKVKRRFI